MLIKANSLINKGIKKFWLQCCQIHYLFWKVCQSLIMLILINFTFKNIIIPFRGGGTWKCVSHLICLFLQTKPGNVRQVIGKNVLKKLVNYWFAWQVLFDSTTQLQKWDFAAAFYFWLQLKSNSTFPILLESIVPSGKRYKMRLFVSIWVCKGRFNYEPGLIPVPETAPKEDGTGQAEFICILALSCNLMASTSGSQRDCQDKKKKEKKKRAGGKKKKTWSL